MILLPELRRELSRNEEARCQTQRQLVIVNRQIRRRMTTLIPGLLPLRKTPDPQAFLDRYRCQLAALTAERHPRIDALSRKLRGTSRRLPDSWMGTAKPPIWAWGVWRCRCTAANANASTAENGTSGLGYDGGDRGVRAEILRSMNRQVVMITCPSVPMSKSRSCRSSLGLHAVLNRRPAASRPRSAPRGGRIGPVSTWQARVPREG
ncbi:hypothetical protein LB543_22185 [Mesorhizobium sp. ESP7-2]|uniref:hypothetical protein n=1 Tax=unclassified Mesorhizobium TaxID=325217 RepID=UPI001CCC6F14|nr:MULTISPECIES: hypothetical protein [unclassified Mesorhizobium]MBZ9673095.1 hypothetical protein [Mesorhizobium sp. ES1-3]MBZ9709433.1 hypothetical protein [Mesorhizobium sp. ESP7-2]